VNTDSPDYTADFSGEVTPDGQLKLDETGRWLGWLMRHKGKRLTITVSRAKIRRSDAQNRRYWSLVIPCFSEWSGFERDEARETLLQMFSSYEDRLPSGEAVVRVVRSSRMTVGQFSDYTSRVERFLAGHGFVFPSDDPVERAFRRIDAGTKVERERERDGGTMRSSKVAR
jgi:hypothetical protein